MKNLKMFTVVIATLLFFSSCYDRGNNGLFNCIKGEGDVVEQELLINEFTGVKLRGSSDVYITQGSEFKVRVEGQQNIIDNIETDVQNDIWEIEFEDCMRDYRGLKFYITMPEIKEIEVSGSGDIFGENEFTGIDDLVLKVDGSGKIDVAVVDATDIDARISGSGKIILEGNANYLGSRISGSGDLKAFDLEVNICNLRITGSGDAEVNVVDELQVRIEGSGDVYYKGNPLIDADITGSGNLKNAN